MQTVTHSTNIQLNSGQLQITPEKRFDYFTCHQMENDIQQYLTTSVNPDIIVDLADVHFIDMTAIKLLERVLNRVQSNGGHCAFQNMSVKVCIILELMGTQLNSI